MLKVRHDNGDILFGVIMTAYNNGNFARTCQTIRSLLRQQYSRWVLYLIGDLYVPPEEFVELAKLVPPRKLVAENRQVAPERSVMEGTMLWCHGGCAAHNHALTLQRRDGVQVTCILNHDDLWTPNHLENLYHCYKLFPAASFVFSKAWYMGGTLPNLDVPLQYDNHLPGIARLVMSSASWKLADIPLNFEINHGVPGDGDMWERIRHYCQEKKLKTLFSPALTVEKGGPRP